MFRFLLRSFLAVLVLAVIAAGSVIGLFWSDGQNLLNRAEQAGWLGAPAEEAPLSVFETTMAKRSFGETWDKTGFPCRAIERLWVSFDESRAHEPMPVSLKLAREMRYDLGQDLDFWNGPREAAFACLLEGRHKDTRLLRFWLARTYAGPGFKDVEAASQALFGKPANKLGLNEAAKLVARIENPNFYAHHAEAWEARTKLILDEVSGKAPPDAR